MNSIRQMRAFFGVLILGLVVVGFQNCSQKMARNSGGLESVANKVDYAYDASLDQLAYMSCNELGSGYDPEVYFTFRGGAYRSGGVMVKANYLTEIGKRSLEDKIQILNLSPAHGSTVFQLALRDQADFNSPYVSSGQGVLGKDFTNLYRTIASSDSYEIDKWLVENPDKTVRYSPSVSVRGDRFEGSLLFGESAILGNDVRNFLTSRGILALTSVEKGSLPRSPESLGDGSAAVGSSRSSVYGRGMYVKFRQPTVTGVNAQYPTYALDTVSEFNMLDRKDQSYNKGWRCPASLQLKIVRPADAKGSDGLNSAACNRGIDAIGDKKTNLIRKSLRTEDWFLDLANRCVVPKKPTAGRSCYGEAGVKVNYNVTQTCSPFAVVPDSNGNASVPFSCSHFVSICCRVGDADCDSLQ